MGCVALPLGPYDGKEMFCSGPDVRGDHVAQQLASQRIVLSAPGDVKRLSFFAFRVGCWTYCNRGASIPAGFALTDIGLRLNWCNCSAQVGATIDAYLHCAKGSTSRILATAADAYNFQQIHVTGCLSRTTANLTFVCLFVCLFGCASCPRCANRADAMQWRMLLISFSTGPPLPLCLGIASTIATLSLSHSYLILFLPTLSILLILVIPFRFTSTQYPRYSDT